MVRWLKSWVLKASADAMRKDLTGFVDGIKGADAEEIAAMLVIANVVRLNLTDMGQIPPAALNIKILRDDSVRKQCEMCPIVLNRFIKQFQNMDQPSDAAGVIIWLHSIRSLNVPELRIYGRAMWKELSRGFPYASDALAQVRLMTKQEFHEDIDCELDFIPKGLEPII